MLLTDRDDPVETLSADRADQSFAERVRLGRSYRRLDDLDAFACEDGVKVAGARKTVSALHAVTEAPYAERRLRPLDVSS